MLTKHKGLLRAIARALVYSLAVLVLTFGSIDSASIAFFVLFAVVFEMACAASVQGWRRIAYLGCVVGLGLAGFFLIHEAIHIERTEVHRRVHNSNMTHLVNSFNEPVFATDKLGRIRACNESFTQLTGFSESELIGRNLASLYGSKQAAKQILLREQLSRSLDTDSDAYKVLTKARRLSIHHKDGRWIPVNVSVIALKGTAFLTNEDVHFFSLSLEAKD